MSNLFREPEHPSLDEQIAKQVTEMKADGSFRMMHRYALLLARSGREQMAEALGLIDSSENMTRDLWGWLKMNPLIDVHTRLNQREGNLITLWIRMRGSYQATSVTRSEQLIPVLNRLKELAANAHDSSLTDSSTSSSTEEDDEDEQPD